MSRLGKLTKREPGWHRRFSGRSYQPPLPFVDGETRFEVFTASDGQAAIRPQQFTTSTSGNTLGTVKWDLPPHHAGESRLREIVKGDTTAYAIWDGDEWRSR